MTLRRLALLSLPLLAAGAAFALGAPSSEAASAAWGCPKPGINTYEQCIAAGYSEWVCRCKCYEPWSPSCRVVK